MLKAAGELPQDSGEEDCADLSKLDPREIHDKILEAAKLAAKQAPRDITTWFMGISSICQNNGESNGRDDDVMQRPPTAQELAEKSKSRIEDLEVLNGSRTDDSNLDKEYLNFMGELESSGLLDDKDDDEASGAATTAAAAAVVDDGAVTSSPTPVEDRPAVSTATSADESVTADESSAAMTSTAQSEVGSGNVASSTERRGEQRVIGEIGNMPGWHEILDTDTNETYFWCEKTNEVQWERPEGATSTTYTYSTSAAEYPTTATQYPTTTAEYPTTATEYPTSTAEYSTTATEYPTTTAEYPTTATEYATSTTQYPTAATQYPTAATEYPTSTTQYPTATAQYPNPTSTGEYTPLAPNSAPGWEELYEGFDALRRRVEYAAGGAGVTPITKLQAVMTEVRVRKDDMRFLAQDAYGLDKAMLRYYRERLDYLVEESAAAIAEEAAATAAATTAATGTPPPPPPAAAPIEDGEIQAPVATADPPPPPPPPPDEDDELLDEMPPLPPEDPISLPDLNPSAYPIADVDTSSASSNRTTYFSSPTMYAPPLPTETTTSDDNPYSADSLRKPLQTLKKKKMKVSKSTSKMISKWVTKKKELEAEEEEEPPDEGDRRLNHLKEWRQNAVRTDPENPNFVPVTGNWREKAASLRSSRAASGGGSRPAAAAVDSKGGQEDGKKKPLPPGWLSLRDPNSDDVYYANVHTQETTWERPT